MFETDRNVAILSHVIFECRVKYTSLGDRMCCAIMAGSGTEEKRVYTGMENITSSIFHEMCPFMLVRSSIPMVVHYKREQCHSRGRVANVDQRQNGTTAITGIMKSVRPG